LTVFVATSKRFYAIKEEIMSIQEGKAAPAFTLPDANGKKVALKDFRGKNVVVYFYPKDNTSG
jgi:peroxiredoxin Q/BCP